MTDKLDAYLANLPIKMKRELATAIKVEADKLAEAIKAAAPVDSGALRESVVVRRERGELSLVVSAGGDATMTEVRKGSGEDYDYSLALEYGTSKDHAQPFFYSTARAMEDEIKRNIEAAVGKALK